MSGLPQSVLDLVELHPVEDIALAVLRDGLPDIPVYSLIPEDAPRPFVLVRRDHNMGQWTGDPRFTDSARVTTHAYVDDPDGDEDAALLSEAIRVVMRNAWLDKKVVPGLGSIISIKMMSEPTRVTDWATSAGPVQFADLPTGVWRYETSYEFKIRKPVS